MSDNKDTLIAKLRALNLTGEEAKLYLELLKEPATHLRLSHITGINRTKVYRLIENLEKRSLVARRVDDRGAFLVAADPATLEVELVAREEKLKQQRTMLTQLLPTLSALQIEDSHSFVIRTYEGVEGFKQMVWHELKTKGELVFFGDGELEEFIPHHRWTAKHRELSVEAGYKIRGLINSHDLKKRIYSFSKNLDYMKNYSNRPIAKEVLLLDHQTVIYNNTVAIYHWRQDQKVGIEIINKSIATMLRQMFEHYWELAGEKNEVDWKALKSS